VAARVGAQSNRSYLGWTVDAFDLFILVFVMDDITLSFCDVADLLAELGILVSYDKAMRQGALNLSTMPLVMVSATLLAARSGEFSARNSMSGGRRAGCYSDQFYRGRASGFQGAEPTGLPPHSTHWCRHGLVEPEPPIKGLAPRFAGFEPCRWSWSPPPF
jgi:hypothetical protein